MDKAKFFAVVRAELFGGALTLRQVYLIETLLDAIAEARWPKAHAAYALATAHHETAAWKHLKELGGEAYFRTMYDKAGKRPHIAAQLGNTLAGDGTLFPGRGFVHLTGRANYRKAGKAIGLDLLKEPQRAEEPTIAARILIWGMSTGAYTGKANRDYLDKHPPDYTGARRIINGVDRAAMIAGYAREFEWALAKAGYGEEPPAKPVSHGAPSQPSGNSGALPPEPDITLPPLPEAQKRVGFWGMLAGFITAVLKR